LAQKGTFRAGSGRDNLKQMLNPIAAILGVSFVLYWIMGESRFLVVILGICGCGLVFVKYLSE
jgi:hypothetical protein